MPEATAKQNPEVDRLGAGSSRAQPLVVVAAALDDGAGRWLLQQRPMHKHHGGHWEFPGGKVDPGETCEAALVRELAEELALTINPAHLTPQSFATGPSASGHVAGQPLVLLLYTASLPAGTSPRACEPGATLGWFTPAAAADLAASGAMPPLDRELLRRLPPVPPAA